MKFVILVIAIALFSPIAVMANDDCLYTYKATVVDVYDGDTITVDLDLGFNTWIRGERVRLARINAPEVRGTEKIFGLPARDQLKNLILNKRVTIKTLKDKKGKYGRYLVEIFLGGMNVNDWMVKKDLAVYKTF